MSMKKEIFSLRNDLFYEALKTVEFGPGYWIARTMPKSSNSVLLPDLEEDVT